MLRKMLGRKKSEKTAGSENKRPDKKTILNIKIFGFASTTYGVRKDLAGVMDSTFALMNLSSKKDNHRLHQEEPEKIFIFDKKELVVLYSSFPMNETTKHFGGDKIGYIVVESDSKRVLEEVCSAFENIEKKESLGEYVLYQLVNMPLLNSKLKKVLKKPTTEKQKSH